jgi:glycosyltransferase involved in cell wall biosynthesis
MATRPLRIVHLRTVAGTGGGPDKTILKSCQVLARAGQVCDAFYLLDRRQDTGRLQAMARELGVNLMVGYESGPVSLSALAAADRALSRGRYDIVHTHEYKSNAVARLLRARRRFEIIATAHGYNQTTRREAMYYWIEHKLFRWVRRIVVPNRAMHQLIESFGIPESKLEIIHNGIEVAGRTRPQRRQRQGPVRVLYLGRLSAEKDPANLLRAGKALLNRGMDIELWIAGDGPERANVEQLSQELDMVDRVRMLGFVEDVPSLLGEVDMLANPSQTECMPNCILEAMWAKLPIAATDVGGVAEMVDHGVQALLCRPRDPHALAEIIGRLVEDEPLADRLAASAGQRVMAEFTFERRMEKMLAMYQRVCGVREGVGA